MKGMVLDIQRCSLNDGPGIRTTVFLKGCPLRCVWCHNPESISASAELMYDKSKCVGCLECAGVCPRGAHKAENGTHLLERELCSHCGRCVKACPYEALRIAGWEAEADEVVAEIARDIKYYKSSGGGVTLSGGEPTYQLEFTADILTKSKELGIHTCIETCGFAPTQKFAELIKLTDIFLFDYKETTPDRHKELTGVSNSLILANLEFLNNNGAKIILRCPLVPGINDSGEHLRGIAELAGRYAGISAVELMPYHTMGVGKLNRLGVQSSLAGVAEASNEIKRYWLDELSRYGCQNVRLG